MSKKIEEIKGIISRIGPSNGASQTDLQFMLENNKNVYIIFAGPMIGLTKIGDEVRFNMRKTLFSVHDHDV